MRINYFYYDKTREDFEVLTEFIAEEQISSSYNIEQIDFSNVEVYPKFIYNLPGYGVFCFCSEENKKAEILKLNVKVKTRVKQISREQNPYLDSYSSKNFLDYQVLFSSLVEGGVDIKRLSDSGEFLEVQTSCKDFEKARSDYYMINFFINRVYKSKESLFYIDNRSESAAEISLTFQDRELYRKTCSLLDFTPNSTLSIEKSFSKNNLSIDDILNIVNLNSA